MSIWVANDRTPCTFRPTSRPYFLITSLRFMCMDSNTMNTWSLNSNDRRNLTQCLLFSGSASISFFSTVISSCAALYMVSLARITFSATSEYSPSPTCVGCETSAGSGGWGWTPAFCARSFALTTVENTPRPWLSITWYRPSNTSPILAR